MVCADNIDIFRTLPDNSIDLIYLDPPFQSDTHYVAIFGDKGMVDNQLKDIWKWTTETERTFRRIPHGPVLDTLKGIRLQAGQDSPMSAYCVFMGRRLMEMHRILKSTGSIYLHCDWHAEHYLRLLLDAIFGDVNFRNEIVWCYTGPGSPGMRQFNRKHDRVLWYSKGTKWTFNRNDIRLPYSEVSANRSKYDWRGGGVQHVSSRAAPSTSSDRTHVIQRGKMPEDWWRIPSGGQMSKSERVGYPTQKPLALLERIIKASSNPGDVVLDPFCGCGTAADAAAKLGRGYLGIDISAIAVRVMEQRLLSRGDAVTPVIYGLDWSEYDWEEFEKRALMGRDDAEDGTPGWAWAEDKVAGFLNAVPNSKKTGDGGVDARYYGAANEVIPIQVKMHRNAPVGRPDMDRLLGSQAAMNNRGINAPMSLMVSLYPPSQPSDLCDRTGTSPAQRRRLSCDASLKC